MITLPRRLLLASSKGHTQFFFFSVADRKAGGRVWCMSPRDGDVVNEKFLCVKHGLLL